MLPLYGCIRVESSNSWGAGKQRSVRLIHFFGARAKSGSDLSMVSRAAVHGCHPDRPVPALFYYSSPNGRNQTVVEKLFFRSSQCRTKETPMCRICDAGCNIFRRRDGTAGCHAPVSAAWFGLNNLRITPEKAADVPNTWAWRIWNRGPHSSRDVIEQCEYYRAAQRGIARESTKNGDHARCFIARSCCAPTRPYHHRTTSCQSPVTPLNTRADESAVVTR